MIHLIPRMPPPDPQVESSRWPGIEALTLTHWMGPRPDPFPEVRARIAYDSEHLHLHFEVKDWHVRAIAEQDQDPVCGDSCVEFFFAPDPENPSAYVNLEINCGGTLLLHTQTGPRTGQKVITREACALIHRSASLPRQVIPEQPGPLDWEVTCSLPFAMLERHCGMRHPAPGTHWRGNFCKCADATSHPHWLTWAPIPGKKPDFHRPDAFRSLCFA